MVLHRSTGIGILSIGLVVLLTACGGGGKDNSTHSDTQEVLEEEPTETEGGNTEEIGGEEEEQFSNYEASDKTDNDPLENPPVVAVEIPAPLVETNPKTTVVSEPVPAPAVESVPPTTIVQEPVPAPAAEPVPPTTTVQQPVPAPAAEPVPPTTTVQQPVPAPAVEPAPPTTTVQESVPAPAVEPAPPTTIVQEPAPTSPTLVVSFCLVPETTPAPKARSSKPSKPHYRVHPLTLVCSPGKSLRDGTETLTITFILYNQKADSDEALWTETKIVEVTGGVLLETLGLKNRIPDGLLKGGKPLLGIRMAEETEGDETEIWRNLWILKEKS